MEDILEVPPVRLCESEPSQANPQSSVVYCSKLNHERTKHKNRFRRTTTFAVILQANYPELDIGPHDEGPWPRPMFSPLPCWACHRRFDRPPVFLPLAAADGVYEEWGNFCCGGCANTYLHTNMRDAFLGTRVANLFDYLQSVHGFRGDRVPMAPHFTQHKTYGGDLDDAGFDELSGHDSLTTHVLRKPFIPTDEVVEWRCVVRTDVKDAEATMARVMGTEAVVSEQLLRWDVTGLKQPPLETIMSRQRALPPLEKSAGLFQTFLAERKRLEELQVDEDAQADAHAAKKKTKKRGAETPATTTPSILSMVGVSAKKKAKAHN